MGSRAVATACWLTWCICPELCQTGLSQPPQRNLPDPAVYLSFFREVAWLKQAPDPVLVNGQTSILRRPTIQEALGLTEEEAQMLNALAADCELKSRKFDDGIRRSTLEARLLAIASEGASERRPQQRKNLDSQRDEMVQDHIQKLKAEFGDSRFEALDAFIRSKKTGSSFFPPLTAEGGAAPVPVHKR
jgi:hypothetical protein